MTNEVTEMFRAIIEDRPDYKVEKVIDGYTGFLFLDKDGMPLVSMHWEHRFNHMVSRYNGFRCPILPLMFADIHIVPIWQSPA